MKNIPSERQMQVTFIWTWYSFFSGQMSLLESTILLGCCTRGPKSSSFWKKKRGPSVCPGRSTVGACNHTGFTAWRSGLFNLKWLPFCNLTHCLNFLSGFHFQASFIIVFFFWTGGTVLCGYSEENGSLPFCIWVTSANPMPSYCWTTCRCF